MTFQLYYYSVLVKKLLSYIKKVGLTKKLQYITKTTINPIKYEGHIQIVLILKERRKKGGGAQKH